MTDLFNPKGVLYTADPWGGPAAIPPARADAWLSRILVHWADEERALSLELRGLASWGGYAVG